MTGPEAGVVPGDDPGCGDGRAAGQSVTDSVVVGDVVQIQNVGRDVTVTLARPVYGVVPWPAVRGGPGVDRARAQPSRLLLARYELVPFAGRTEVRQKLAGWLGEQAPVSVRLVHGPGGQGKSRLAAQFAREQAGRWQVWQARQPLPTASSPQRLTAPGEAGGLLLVVDYADRWPTSHLQALIVDLYTLAGRLPMAPVLRVLLLARSAGWWWEALENWLDADLDIPADAVALPPLGGEGGIDRRSLFTDARDAFAEAMQLPGCAHIAPPRELEGAPFAQVLTVHMAALAAVDARHHGATVPADPHRISAYLLQRERAHWHHWHARDSDPLPTPPQTMDRAVYLATLAGPLTHASGVQALGRAQVTSLPENANQVLTDHQLCYPSDNPGTVLEPLYPDRLGEDFLALTTPGGPGGFADAWADAAITRLFEPVSDDTPPGLEAAGWIRPALTVLIETARRWPHVADRLYRLLAAHPDLAVHAGGAGLAALAGLSGIAPDLLQAIEAHLPGQRHADLDAGIAAIAARLAEHRLATTTDPDQRADIHHRLGVRLHNAGLHHQALTATQEAVDTRRRLAQANPDAYEPDLARSLNNLSVALSEVGRWERALTVTQEAVRVYRRLAQAKPDAYEPDLARSLNNLSADLSGMGRWEEALTIIQEAVDIRRRLAHANPDAYESDLAVSLNNLSAILSEVGRWEEALTVVQEAVGVYRRLVQVGPDAFEPDLAMSLNNLGLMLSGVGREEEALTAAQEAARIYRRLVQVGPDAFEPGLARSLNNLSVALSEVGRWEEALTIIQEAVDIRRRLTQADRDAYEPDLAASLINLGLMLSGVGREEEALTATQEAARIYRQLAQTNPDAYEPDLAMSLDNLGTMLSGVRRREEALTTTQEAVDILQRLTQANRDAYEPDLARSLRTCAEVRVALHTDLAGAFGSIRESAAIYQRLAARLPRAFTKDLSAALRAAADVLDGLQQSRSAQTLRRLTEAGALDTAAKSLQETALT
ncbi:tetratricopeptide repeat protein [Actinoallomurus purpureus]|uniref:tetratricopeptide repeat protein n=1 Tax=Actinoallomurus purpureus TaxID=478114 RepID=UPI0020927D2B|nr:tetratricopeptide repeat protein [Actinoallomurus purpureus]MCO6011089.1 tetratricopeptide repeat protein [Actinoallomurus purpureus]